MRLPPGAGAWAASVLALALGAAAVARTARVDTGMEGFVLDAASGERLGILSRLLSSRRARTIVFALGADDEPVHRQAALELRQQLVASGRFTWVRGGAEASDAETFYRLYFPHRWGLIEPPAAAGELAPWLRARVAAAKQSLAGPLGGFAARILPQDPIGAFPEILRQLQEQSGPVTDRGGQLMTADGRHSIVFAQSSAAALDGALQTPVVETIERTLRELRARSNQRVSTLWTGVNRFAVETERRIRRELGWIAALSIVPVLLLYGFVFRSLRQFFAGFTVIGIALGVAVLTCQAVFGSVHGLALTFGASLIGVTIDYAAHYSVHLADSRPEDRSRMLRMLLRATSTGVVTTVAAFAAVAGGQLPVLRQIALLGVTGALVGFALTHLLLPLLVAPPAAAAPPSTPAAVASSGAGARPGRGDVLLGALDRHARAVMIVSGAVLLLAISGLARWRWSDRVDAFKTPLPHLEAEAASLQRLLDRDPGAPQVVVTGPDDERALQQHEHVVARLRGLERAGAPVAFASIDRVLVSAGTQRERVARLRTPGLDAVFRAALVQEGFRPEAFPAWHELLEKADQPLRPADLASSPAAFLVDSFRLDPGPAGPAAAGYVVDLRQGADQVQLAAALEGLAGVWIARPTDLLQETYGLFRQRILRWLAVGAAAIVLIMLVVYRRPSLVIAGVLPAVLGCAATLGLLGQLGIAGNVLHVVGLVLVLGLGVDYGVYLVEARHGSLGLSIRGILLGASTTGISFGALAFSSNAAVRTLGLTSALGIVLTTVTCPLVILILRGRPKVP